MLSEARDLLQSEAGQENLRRRIATTDDQGKAWANYNGREDALPGFCELEPCVS